MTKTLADMTPEERDQCVGMWATYLGVETGVILWPNNRSAYILFPDGKREQTCKNRDVVPRFDLPRAWTPEGKPVPGEWADGHMWWGEDTDTMQTADLVGAECLTTGQVQGLGEWPEGVTPGEDVPVRRFVSEWEDA